MSPDLTSTDTNAIVAEVTAWQSRPFDPPLYPVVFFDALRVTIRDEAARTSWTRVTPFFAFRPEIRRVLYTTNTLESVHARLRKIINTRGHVPNDEAATKLIGPGLAQYHGDAGAGGTQVAPSHRLTHKNPDTPLRCRSFCQ